MWSGIQVPTAKDFKVLIAVSIMITDFWDMRPCFCTWVTPQVIATIILAKKVETLEMEHMCSKTHGTYL
jgi:hypothetical protein